MNYVDPNGHVSSYLTGDAPEWTSGNQVPVPAAGQYIPNTTNYGSTLTDNGGALLGEVLGGLAAGVVLTLGAPVSLPIAAFLIAVGSATGMVVGGTVQKNHQTKLTQKQINEIDKLLNQYEDELKTLAQGGEISEKKFNKLQQDMEDLVENKLQLCGDLEDLQEDIEGYEALGKITVMVAGTAMTLGELLGIGGVSNGVQLVNNGGMVSFGRAINDLPKNQGYSSFNQLKKAIGSAGKGNDWHHIVEQVQIGKSGFAAEQINNTSNIIAVDHAMHMKISGYYSRIYGDTGLSLRNWLAGQSFETQYEMGIEVLKMFGVIQ